MKTLVAIFICIATVISPALAIEWQDIDPGDRLWQKSIISENRLVVVVSKANSKVLVRYDDGTKDYVATSDLMTESERSEYNVNRVGAAVGLGIGILSIFGEKNQ